MKRLCLLLSFLAVAAMPPPPKRHKPFQPPKQGSGAQALIAKSPKLKPKAAVVPMQLVVMWDWTPTPGNDYSNIVFYVQTSPTPTGPARNWPVVGMVTTNYWPLTIDKLATSLFFHAYASNTVTHLVSQ